MKLFIKEEVEEEKKDEKEKKKEEEDRVETFDLERVREREDYKNALKGHSLIMSLTLPLSLYLSLSLSFYILLLILSPLGRLDNLMKKIRKGHTLSLSLLLGQCIKC